MRKPYLNNAFRRVEGHSVASRICDPHSRDGGARTTIGGGYITSPFKAPYHSQK